MQKVKIDPFKIIGISVRTTNENGQGGKDIAELWGRFLSEGLLNAIPGKVDDTIYSLYTDYEGDHTKPYTAILGCKVKSLEAIPDGMVGRTFEGGSYVKITAKGDLTKGLIVSEWTKIWGLGLDRAFSADFEVFGEKAQNPANAEVDFLVAVK
ncbi:MAG: GyrI-like domain-containing protein [Imperialibacter sp.]|uniref:GyrI-like domain-containing protein n=1 Tax=Imperialibacter sp. TaxID=2038411 RepID=UPI0032EA9FFB